MKNYRFEDLNLKAPFLKALNEEGKLFGGKNQKKTLGAGPDELKNPEDKDPHVANDIGINVRRVVDDPNPQPMETIDIPEDALFAVHVIGDDRELDAEAVEFLAERPGPGPAEPAE